MKNQIFRTLVLQYILGGIYLLGAGLWDISIVLSALVGCAAAWLPSTYFGLRMLKISDQDDAARWLGFALRSEIGKWVTMAAVFALAFSIDYPWNPIALFAGFALVLISGWFAPWVAKGN